MEDDLVNCECHGSSVAAVVCCHLANNNGHPIGFIENSDEPNDLQGWCLACEYLYDKELEMTEKFRAFTGISIVCTQCYYEIKAKHSIAI
ncbi:MULTISPECIES: hypothetical protein [unclassified Colwellia]|jgi:hypothetical protein|uniref:hypothetical protein n=1 Tax=unclassified Colwellia TaxID=196834 RepID=UPI0015F6024C|nr:MULTISPECIES: hypothetical protein [unclassified Colwellia]MBA6231501.1 hypothetical protein [Colwellia sp. MB02u-7]MBA6235955.1 hypothetical protein [Colwellia sp. MB02u-11]MBA6297901.1 hypothetical protein [Colwellia sp. MB3u-22]MBA6309901.1 hypothetical protein [Colwellia sp. MB3u-64]